MLRRRRYDDAPELEISGLCMAVAATRAVVCPVLVGRAQYVDAIERVLDAVMASEGTCASVCGEAGIGKSRLVNEVQARMSSRSARVMQGHCFEPDAALPYAPIVDMLRACFASPSASEIAGCAGPDASELVKLLPELAVVLPSAERVQPLEPEQEKRRMFLALAGLFARIAAKQPLLIIVEDLHWSDDTSLEFLLHLARRVAPLPILLLFTYRSDEVQPPLGHFMAQLERERLVTEWPLAKLDPPEVHEMIRAIFDLDAPVRADFLDAIYGLTEGNPFFIEEVLKSLVASGDIFFADGTWDRKPLSELNIPRSVHDAVRVRTDQLSADAQELLILAAVTGRRFDFGLLQRCSQCDEQDLLNLIKEMMAAQLVAEDSDDHFSFRHALTQHVIYGDLLVRERRVLHRTIAENMRQMYANSIEAHLADLAHHFYEAGAWDEAYYYCRRVGENAQTLLASRAAVEHLTRAIESARHLAITPPAKLYRARGQAHEALGEFERARGDFELALETARAANDGLGEWQAHIDLGSLWAVRDYQKTGESFRTATALARTLGDQKLIGQSLNRLGNWLVNTGEPAEALTVHGDALTIFDAEGDDAGRASTFDLLGMAQGIYGDMARSKAALDQSVALFRQLGDEQGLVSSLATRGTFSSPGMQDVAESLHRTPDESARDPAESAELARRIGWQSGRAYGEFTASSVASGFGDLGAAIRHGQESLRIACEIEHEQWMLGARYNLGHAYVRMRIADLALHHLEEALPAARKLGSEWWLGNISSNLALAYLLNGDPARARTALVGAMPREQAPRTLAQRRVSLAWAELALTEGEPEVALALADQLLASVPGSTGQPIPTVLGTHARALVALKHVEDAEADLAAAEREAAERGDRPLLWQLQRALARILDATGRRDQASSKRAEADAVVAALAATIDDERVRQQFLDAALEAPARPLSSRQAEKAAFGGLTAREREVAALIAQGKSNRDIAQELVLGERTIETHVGNILSKLQFGSRAQVAAWAVEVGLRAKRA